MGMTMRKRAGNWLLILHPSSHDRFVRLVKHVLEIAQADHQPDRLVGERWNGGNKNDDAGLSRTCGRIRSD